MRQTYSIFSQGLSFLLMVSIFFGPALAKAAGDAPLDCEGIYSKVVYPAPLGSCQVLTAKKPTFDKNLADLKATCQSLANQVATTNGGTAAGVGAVAPSVSQKSMDCIPAAQAFVGAGNSLNKGSGVETIISEQDNKVFLSAENTTNEILSAMHEPSCEPQPYTSMQQTAQNLKAAHDQVVAYIAARSTSVANQKYSLGTNVKNLMKGCGDEVLIGAGLAALLAGLLSQMGQKKDNSNANDKSSKSSSNSSSLGAIPELASSEFSADGANSVRHVPTYQNLPSGSNRSSNGPSVFDPGPQDSLSTPVANVPGKSIGDSGSSSSSTLSGSGGAVRGVAATGAENGGRGNLPGNSPAAESGATTANGATRGAYIPYSENNGTSGGTYVPNQGDGKDQNYFGPTSGSNQKSGLKVRVPVKAATSHPSANQKVDCKNPNSPRCAYQRTILGDPLLRQQH